MSLTFQISDWGSYHEIDDNYEDKYVIQLTGRTQDDKSVYLKIKDFYPYFYIKIPDYIADNDKLVQRFLEEIRQKVSYRSQSNMYAKFDPADSLLIDECKVVDRIDFNGFCANEKDKFLELKFKSHTAMRAYANLFAKPIKCKTTGWEEHLFERYESNIEPHIRFMHITNIQSTGWVRISKKYLTHLPDDSNCDQSYSVDWTHVRPSKIDNQFAPFKIMGYDIECTSCDINFPQANRKTDRIITIGCSMFRLGSLVPYERHVLSLKKCAPIKDATVECYKTEEGLIKGFARKIKELAPDFMVGYNNFGFDDKYIKDRIDRIDKENAIKANVHIDKYKDKLHDYFLNTAGKINNEHLLKTYQITKSLNEFKVQMLSSSALGDNELKFWKIVGTVSVDVMKVIQREHKLTGYKLDNVSANFIKEKASKIEINSRRLEIFTVSTKGLDIGSYVQLMVKDAYSISPFKEGGKYKVIDITTKSVETSEGIKEMKAIKIKFDNEDVEDLHNIMKSKDLSLFWTFAKDDMHYMDINRYFKEGDAKKIKKYSEYCLKDCDLPCLLLTKLDTIISSMSMARVCHVPVSYIFFRGQGVKALSLVSKRCREEGYLIKVLHKEEVEDDDGYEGAAVISPTPGVYLVPISVLDFNSLYPNSMREKNLSLETHVKDNNKALLNKKGFIYHYTYITLKDKNGRARKNVDGSIMRKLNIFAQELVTKEQIDNELKDVYAQIPKDIQKECDHIMKQKKSDEEKDKLIKKIKESLDKRKDDAVKCRYNIVNGKYVRYGVIPAVLTELLNKRAETRVGQKYVVEKSAEWNILECLQLAYKITANSLYGQTGAPTSALFYKEIAETTTAIGREKLHFAKKLIEEHFPGSKIIYGDTDSVFIDFGIKNPDGTPATDEASLKKAIGLAMEAADLINSKLPTPQKIVYEKTFQPFILVTKKKYVGLKYEGKKNYETGEISPGNGYLTSMGIVLKRRDNAVIVKIVVGGIVDEIVKTKDVNKAIIYVSNTLTKMFAGEYKMDKFIISKTLKSAYKKPNSIAHKVLADRMAIRDPGNAPQPSDRIPYVFAHMNIDPNKKDVLQGDLIEHPEYVISNKMSLDYLYYLEHQIQTPASQILELMMPKKEVDKLFGKFALREKNKRSGQKTLDSYTTDGKAKKDELYQQKGHYKPPPPKIPKNKRNDQSVLSPWMVHGQTPSSKKQDNKPKTRQRGVKDAPVRSHNIMKMMLSC
jgi:DNA polymerase elongation subunit (family B)